MFSSHGKFIVSRKANIVEVDATGPFNHEAVIGYQNDIIDCVEDIQGSWGQVVYIHDNCFYTPGAEQLMYGYCKARQDLGLKAIALVLMNNDAMQIMKDKIADYYQRLNIPHQFFTEQSVAQKWLDSQLAPFNSDRSSTPSETINQLICHF